jgi:signal transduction histidine kinase
MDVEHESIDLPSLVREVLGFLEKEASYREISVTIDQEEGLPTISSDRGQLQQVFLNILNNAFAAVSDGGHIEISARRAPNDMVAVAVKDDGVGIPRDRLKEIFEPFFTTKEGFGTGLGLSITYGIVHKLRGRIEVESELGKGTTFTVLLPIGA